MTEEEARQAVTAIAGAAACERLEQVAAAVLAENDRQNLIARSTAATIWARHILDSVQLLQWAGDGEGPWLDIGTGGGFPGLAIAAVRNRPIWFVEPRARRAHFLRDTAEQLGLGHVTVVQGEVQALRGMVPAIVSARAVAKPAELIDWTFGLADHGTRWLLQRGASWQADHADLTAAWKGSFHVEHSLTNPDGRIIVATGVARR